VGLPRVDEAVSVVAEKSSDDLTPGTESVLGVEDDSTVRRLAVFVLRDCGYQVQEACHTVEALGINRKEFQVQPCD
jgi:CheY-like chemotaxis protein